MKFFLGTHRVSQPWWNLRVPLFVSRRILTGRKTFPTALEPWAQHYGLVSVGFGLMAPAGVYFAGLAFTLRDVTQRLLGRQAASLAILAGAALSYFVSERLAVASAVAFLLSEFADFAVYVLLERQTFLGAVVVSNIVGLVVDSLLFLWIAFGSLEFLPGQIVGKAWMTAAAVPLVLLARKMLPEREPARA